MTPLGEPRLTLLERSKMISSDERKAHSSPDIRLNLPGQLADDAIDSRSDSDE